LTGIATFLFGIGFYGQSDYLTIGGAAFTPHNTYLTVLSAQGIIGLMIFVHMILRILFKGLKILLNGSGNDLSGIKTPVSLLTGFIILLVHYNTIGLYTTGYVWVFIALTIASFRRSRAIQVREGSECRGGLKWKEQK
jgi:O-antigen ligase